jgi:hypothetical protein
MLEGIAGGITPWWHIVGSAQEDRRIFDISMPIMQWHKKYEPYLYNRVPVANVGILWSQNNVEFFGAAQAKDRVELSWRGIIMALTRAGIPFLPINAEDIAEQTKDISLLILPELALISEEQAGAIEAFAAAGGNILAIGNIGIMDTEGSLRRSSCLEKLLGVRFETVDVNDRQADASWENPVLHNYLRIEQKQHPIFKGFEKTATLPMGGTRKNIITFSDTKVLATHIPAYPIFPPEFSWTEVTHTDQPVITEYALPGGGKAVYAAWDLDSAYGRTALPDQGDLIGNMVRYLTKDKLAIQVECDAYLDFKCYRQENRLIIHLININHTGFAQGYAEKNVPVGPVKITVSILGYLPSGVLATEDEQKVKLTHTENGFTLELETLGVHQLLVVE